MFMLFSLLVVQLFISKEQKLLKMTQTERHNGTVILVNANLRSTGNIMKEIKDEIDD